MASENVLERRDMKLTDLDFSYPEELIATSPQRPSRVMWVDAQNGPSEISLADLLEKIPAGDLLVLNNTRVLKRRVFSGDVEILFLKQINDTQWEVLFPSKKYKVGASLDLPLGVSMKLVQKPPRKWSSLAKSVEESIVQHVDPALSCNCLVHSKARDAATTVQADESWYQRLGANRELSRPTASAFFEAMTYQIKSRGVRMRIELHWLGTSCGDGHDLDQPKCTKRSVNKLLRGVTGTWARIKRR